MGAPAVVAVGGQSRGERWAVWLLVGLSLLFAIVPDTLSVNAVGPEANHTIEQGSMLRQVQYGSLFLGALFVLWHHVRPALMNLRASNLFLMLLVLYCLVSATWSPYPDITIKRTIIFAGLVLIGLTVAPPFSSPRQFLRVILGTYTIVLVLSCLVAVFIPSMGVDTLLGNAWRGITWQKNMLGSIAGFAVLLWLREWLMTPSIRRMSAVGLLFSVFMLVMAKSATAMLVTGLGAGVYLLTRKRFFGGRHTGQILMLGALLVALYFLLMFYVAVGRMPQVDDVVLLGLNLAGFIVGVVSLVAGYGGVDARLTIVLNLIWTVYNIVMTSASVAVAGEVRQLRNTPRVAISLAAMLLLPDGRTVACRTSDYSQGGLGLVLPPGVLVPNGMPLSVSLFRNDEEAMFPALVTFSRGDRLGISFQSLTLEQERDLAQMTFGRADTWASTWGNNAPDSPWVALRQISSIGVRGFSLLLRQLRDRSLAAVRRPTSVSTKN